MTTTRTDTPRTPRARLGALLLACLGAAAAAAAGTSEITIDLKLDQGNFVVGERIRGVVNVINMSADRISVGRPSAPDRLFVEVFLPGMRQMQRTRERAFVAPFLLKPNEGQKLETLLDRHYGLRAEGHYLARPVLVHRGTRYEGRMRAFDVVPGVSVAKAAQLFVRPAGLRRNFEAVRLSREGQHHLFLKATDEGCGDRSWNTQDLGPMMTATPPTVSVTTNGVVIVLQRYDSDNFLRSEFWSVPDGLEFARRDLLQDPETAGSARVRELYRGAGGIKAKKNPWWKFW